MPSQAVRLAKLRSVALDTIKQRKFACILTNKKIAFDQLSFPV